MPNRAFFIALLGVFLVASVPVTVATDNVSAEHGSVGVGGNVENSNITTGATPEQVETLIRASTKELRTTYETRVKTLSGQLGVTQDALTSFFQILREQNVPLEKLPDTLATIAQRFREMQERLAVLNPDDPATKALIEKARSALNAGHYDLADALLSQAEATEQAAARQAEQLARDARAAADRRWLNAAAARAERGELSLTRLNYWKAAAHFKAATDMTPASAPTERGTYRRQWADTLSEYGWQKGDNTALRQALHLYRQALADLPRDRTPRHWAATQINLGIALAILGERETGTVRLEKAVAAYRAALEEFTHDRAPIIWATTQTNLGAALATLGERETGTARLEAAVAAYRAALEELTSDRMLPNWVTTQNNLGLALAALGEREGNPTRLEAAVATYRAALEELTRERASLAWATIQNNLGIALEILGAWEASPTRLEEAIATYQAALEERTRERVPLSWAATQINLGNALATLGERETGTARLEEAVTAYLAALEEATQTRTPFLWVVIQQGLAKTYRALKDNTKATAICQELHEANLGYQCN
ncbi:MAG: tetratricopeptide repeat protein [Candidatus Competibacteraceae bacterium]|nr:tetratricopeptide repeat protein [Candidatus Competibacteraceae bacterium]